MSEPVAAATLKPGSRLRSAGSAVEVIVVRAPSTAVKLTCSDAAMVGLDVAPGPRVHADEQVVLGKRYVDEVSGLELLCTKPGPGVLAADARELTLKGAKPLPSSD